MMPVLQPGRVFRSRTPAVLIENPLEAGRWRFRLTVVDDQRNESAAAELIVSVQRERTPPRPVSPRPVPVRPRRPIG